MDEVAAPGVLAYRGGDCFANLVSMINEMPAGRDINSASVESVLQRYYWPFFTVNRQRTATNTCLDTRFLCNFISSTLVEVCFHHGNNKGVLGRASRRSFGRHHCHIIHDTISKRAIDFILKTGTCKYPESKTIGAAGVGSLLARWLVFSLYRLVWLILLHTASRGWITRSKCILDTKTEAKFFKSDSSWLIWQ